MSDVVVIHLCLLRRSNRRRIRIQSRLISRRLRYIGSGGTRIVRPTLAASAGKQRRKRQYCTSVCTHEPHIRYNRLTFYGTDPPSPCARASYPRPTIDSRDFAVEASIDPPLAVRHSKPLKRTRCVRSFGQCRPYQSRHCQNCEFVRIEGRSRC